MLAILAVILVIAWLGGFTVLHVSSMAIHLLLLFAIVSIVLHFARSRRVT